MKRDQKFEKIALVFENCEYSEIDAKHVSHVYVDDIQSNMYVQNRVADDVPYVHTSKHCKYLSIHLQPECKDNTVKFNPTVTGDFTLFDRINRYADITAIEFLKDAETLDYIYVNYKGEEVNELQSHTLDDEGVMIIEIGVSNND